MARPLKNRARCQKGNGETCSGAGFDLFPGGKTVFDGEVTPRDAFLCASPRATYHERGVLRSFHILKVGGGDFTNIDERGREKKICLCEKNSFPPKPHTVLHLGGDTCANRGERDNFWNILVSMRKIPAAAEQGKSRRIAQVRRPRLNKKGPDPKKIALKRSPDSPIFFEGTNRGAAGEGDIKHEGSSI